MASFYSRCSSAWETKYTGREKEWEIKLSRNTGRQTYLFWFCGGWKIPQAMTRWIPSRYSGATKRSEQGVHVLWNCKLLWGQLKKRGGVCARERGSGEKWKHHGAGGGKPEVSGILINLGAPEACLLALFCFLDHFPALSVHYFNKTLNSEKKSH